MKCLSSFVVRHLALALSVLFVPSGFSQQAPLDFSTAGYASQSRPIPAVPVRVFIARRERVWTAARR